MHIYASQVLTILSKQRFSMVYFDFISFCCLTCHIYLWKRKSDSWVKWNSWIRKQCKLEIKSFNSTEDKVIYYQNTKHSICTDPWCSYNIHAFRGIYNLMCEHQLTRLCQKLIKILSTLCDFLITSLFIRKIFIATPVTDHWPPSKLSHIVIFFRTGMVTCVLKKCTGQVMNISNRKHACLLEPLYHTWVITHLKMNMITIYEILTVLEIFTGQ